MKQAEFTLTIKDPKRDRLDKLEVNISRLARQTGYSPSHLSRVFTQQTVPSLKCLGELATTLKMNIAELHCLIIKGEVNIGK